MHVAHLTKGIFIFAEFSSLADGDLARAGADESLVVGSGRGTRMNGHGPLVRKHRISGRMRRKIVHPPRPAQLHTHTHSFQAGTFSVSAADTVPTTEAYDRFARQWRAQASTKWDGGCSDQRDPSTAQRDRITCVCA